jgi:hypothetical protein
MSKISRILQGKVVGCEFKRFLSTKSQIKNEVPRIVINNLNNKMESESTRKDIANGFVGGQSFD